jgi:hypothetical protein
MEILKVWKMLMKWEKKLVVKVGRYFIELICTLINLSCYSKFTNGALSKVVKTPDTEINHTCVKIHPN